MKPGVRVWPRHQYWLYAMWIGAFGLFALAVKTIPVHELRLALSSIQFGSLLILGGLNLAVIVLLSARWWLILRSQGLRINLFPLTGYRLAAFSIAYFTPGPQFGGEPLQVHLLRTKHDVPNSSAIASVSLDRLLELIANFSFLVCGLFVVLQSGLLGNLPTGKVLVVALSFAMVPVIYLVSLTRRKQPLTSLLQRFERPAWQANIQTLREAEHLVGEFCRQKPLALLSAIAISLVTWMVMVTEYTLLLNYLGLAVSLPQALIALTAARLAFIVPTPGGLGAFEASQVLAAEALGFSPLSGLTVSLVIRARDLLIAGLGLWLSAVYLKKSPKQVRFYQTTMEE